MASVVLGGVREQRDLTGTLKGGRAQSGRGEHYRQVDRRAEAETCLAGSLTDREALGGAGSGDTLKAPPHL